MLRLDGRTGFLDLFLVLLDGQLQGPHQLVAPALVREPLQALHDPGQVLLPRRGRGDHLADGGVIGGPPALFGRQQLFREPLTRTQAGDHDLDVNLRPQAS